MRKRGILALFLLVLLLIAGCSSYFGDNVKGVDVGSGDAAEDGNAMKYGVKPFLDCDALEGKDKDFCFDLQASDLSSLDGNTCENIQNDELTQYCKDRVCMFAGNCKERTFRAYYVNLIPYAERRSVEVNKDSRVRRDYNYGVKELLKDDGIDLKERLLADSDTIEFSSQEYEAVLSDEIRKGKEANVAVSFNSILMVFKVPENFKYAFMQGGDILDGVPVQGIVPKYLDFAQYAYVRVPAGDKVKYVHFTEYGSSGLAAYPVINGEVSLIVDIGGNKIIDQLFSNAYFAEHENFAINPYAGRTYMVNNKGEFVEYGG